MLMKQSKIQQHKADIEKRICQLEKKLKEPVKTTQTLQQQSAQGYARRSLMARPIQEADNYEYQRRSEYVEPVEVQEIRKRNILREKTALQKDIENRRPNYDRDRYLQPTSKYDNYRPKPQGKIINNSFHAHQLSSPQHTSTTANNNRDIYDMMAMILQNQKNLQQEIVIIRSEWAQKERSQKHTSHKNSESHQTPVHDINQSTLGKSMLQDPNKTYQIRNLYPENNNKNIGKVANTIQQHPQQIKPQKRADISQQKLKDYSIQHKTQAIYKNQAQNNNNNLKPLFLNESQPQIYPEKQQQRKNKAQSQKKNTSIDLYSLVKNQKNRDERLIITEQSKNQFWRKVDERIRESQKQYRDTYHRNNRHEHEHLIGTSELQKKLKSDLLDKIYSQCNKCYYK